MLRLSLPKGDNLAKQINDTIVGTMTDVPYLVVDNGHRYSARVENPQRVVFELDDAEPAWGATIYFGGDTLRLVVPVNPGAYEGPILTYAPALRRLAPAGNQLQMNGKPWVWAMMTGFCDYQLYLTGQYELLRAVLQQAKDLGANGRRVLGMMAYITQFDPRSFPRYYDNLSGYADLNAQYGQYIHFDIFADNQVYNLGVDHYNQVVAQLQGKENVIIGAGNEFQKNGFNPYTLPQPGVIASQGSSTSDTAPPMPGWGIRMWHGRRDAKVFLSADDMWFVGMGVDEEKGQYAPVAPAVHDEPMGFAEVNIPGRRSTDPRLAQSLMLSGRAYGAGATYHSESGIYSRILGPTEVSCGHAFFDAQG